jgi:hypothetical protein
MKRELLTHLIYWLVFTVLIVLVKRYFNINVLQFIFGGLIGTFLPDLDHIIYIYFIKPQDLTSQRVNYLVNKNELVRGVELMYETRTERRGLIFHTILFQGIFFVLMFLMLSSSASLFGRGLVLSFMLHLSVDQMIDLKEVNGLENWFKDLSFTLDLTKSKIYWITSSVVVLLMGIVM